MDATQTPAATHQTTRRWTAFETQTCSRCGGSGTYSYTQDWGTACFICGKPHVPGRGEVLTARGAAASTFLTEILSKRAGDLVAGDVVRPRRCRSFLTVESVAPSTNQYREGDGPWVVMGDRGYLTITMPGLIVGAHEDTMMRVAHTAEAKTAAIALAVRYQECLTKRGTERKTKAMQAEIAKIRAEAANL